MALSKEKKQQIVSELKTRLAGAGTIVFLNCRGLSVRQTEKFRQGLKALGATLRVVKKTLLRRVLKELPELPGELALVYGPDQLAPARGVGEFLKTNKEALKILGGVFEGRSVGAEFMEELAFLPPAETLNARLVALLTFPLRRLMLVLTQIHGRR